MSWVAMINDCAERSRSSRPPSMPWPITGRIRTTRRSGWVARDHSFRHFAAQRLDHLDELMRAAVRQIVTVDRRHDDMLKPPFANSATFAGSRGFTFIGMPVLILQKAQARVQVSPRIITVASSASNCRYSDRPLPRTPCAGPFPPYGCRPERAKVREGAFCRPWAPMVTTLITWSTSSSSRPSTSRLGTTTPDLVSPTTIGNEHYVHAQATWT